MTLDPIPFDTALSIYRGQTLLDPGRLRILYGFAQQAHSGELWECGVFRGGSAAIMTAANRSIPVRLFDTFAGLPKPSEHDNFHKAGDFSETSLARVQMTLLGSENAITYHQGLIPETFRGLEQSKIALAHIDLDLYQSTRDALEFIFPRLTPGGVIVLDDYNWKNCVGVNRAVDEFVEKTARCRLLPSTGVFQAVMMRDKRYITA